MMTTLGDRLASRLQALKMSQGELARRVAMKQQGIQSIIAGAVERPRKLREIARETKTTEAYLLGESDHPGDDEGDLDAPLQVPLVGYVGAGQTIHQFQEPEGALEQVEAPDGSNRDTVAVEIRGDSLGPLFNRWLAFYDRREEPITENLLGRLCVVGLMDDRVMVKYVKAARAKGLYDLLSNVGDPIKSVAVKWGARVKHLMPRT